MIKILTRLAQYSDNLGQALVQGYDNPYAQYTDNHPVRCPNNLDPGLVLVGIVVPSWLQSVITHNTIDLQND